jgi:hypothetical protein
MSREAHVRFCERAVAKFRRATRLIVFGEAHLSRILGRCAAYYNAVNSINLSLTGGDWTTATARLVGKANTNEMFEAPWTPQVLWRDPPR